MQPDLYENFNLFINSGGSVAVSQNGEVGVNNLILPQYGICRKKLVKVGKLNRILLTFIAERTEE